MFSYNHIIQYFEYRSTLSTYGPLSVVCFVFDTIFFFNMITDENDTRQI